MVAELESECVREAGQGCECHSVKAHDWVCGHSCARLADSWVVTWKELRLRNSGSMSVA